MGKNNRARRAAKAKQRRNDQRAPGKGTTAGQGFGFSARELAAGWLDLGAARLRAGDSQSATIFVEKLATLPLSALTAEVEAGLLTALRVLAEHGWQPGELHRQVRRVSSAAATRLAANALIAGHAHLSADVMHPAWRAQLDELAGICDGPRPTAPSGWFLPWQQAARLELTEALEAAMGTLAVLRTLGPIAEVLAPPGRSPLRHAGADHDDPRLAKVRALLAQAESTTFPAEAEAFTAKAQELMTRYAIDRALLEGDAGTARPATRRIAIDEPYIDAKSYLMQVVAEHSRCRAVFHSSYAFSSIVGFEDDLDAAELLFTSLLVQAQVALTAEARNAPAGARTRSRGFRSSFLVSYARRIGDRLAEINRGVITTVEAETKRSTLPVLAARRKEVDDAIDEQFGDLRASAVRANWDGLGNARGRLAADQAQLNFGDIEHAATES